MKIAIIEGSIRKGHNGGAVAQWVLDQAQKHGGADFELVKLADFNVPLLTSETVPGAAGRQYDSAEVTAWGKKIDEFDGFIFVTPEYNHSVPGAFKNAVDSIGPEWQGKVVGLVAYGADGGVRSVEHWRQILANFSMHVVRAQLSLSLFTEFGPEGFKPDARRDAEIETLFDQVITATEKFRP